MRLLLMPINLIEHLKLLKNFYFSEEELKGHVRDLFVAGTDTTSTTLKWCLILLINRKEIQKKVAGLFPVVI